MKLVVKKDVTWVLINRWWYNIRTINLNIQAGYSWVVNFPTWVCLLRFCSARNSSHGSDCTPQLARSCARAKTRTNKTQGIPIKWGGSRKKSSCCFYAMLRYTRISKSQRLSYNDELRDLRWRERFILKITYKSIVTHLTVLVIGNC